MNKYSKVTTSGSNNFDVIVINTIFTVSYFSSKDGIKTSSKDKADYLSSVEEEIKKCSAKLKDGGFMFIYGLPAWLPEYFNLIRKDFTFRYWIAIDGGHKDTSIKNNIPKSHVGLLMLSKGNKYGPLNTKQEKISYSACLHCRNNLKDWGGNKHLMNKNGTAISDVWTDFYHKNGHIVDSIGINLELVDFDKTSIKIDGKIIPPQILDRIYNLTNRIGYRFGLHNIIVPPPKSVFKTPPSVDTKTRAADLDKVVMANCIEEMKRLYKRYPNGCFDIFFADPPYNLDKKYDKYKDTNNETEYINWSNEWLDLGIKLLKPGGSLFSLNIPEWSLHQAIYLNDIAYFQNWIVWDSMSVPLGKIMPAHYSLLHYSQTPNVKFCGHKWIDNPGYCLRASCIKARTVLGDDKKVVLADIWSDVHRIKHKKNRDYHPCQLPHKLMERIISLFSKEGDLIFDPFAGAGTTAIVAKKLNRHYYTTEISADYINITNRRLKEVGEYGDIVLRSVKHDNNGLTKKSVELVVQKLALELSRKPTLEELLNKGKFKRTDLTKLYGDENRALKVARVALTNSN